jgi:AmmeMemoRadiSam system protein B
MPASGRRTIRRPAVAGLFYPADDASCAAAATELLRANTAALKARAWRGAIVPHAGWICSGAIAGESIATIQASRDAAGLKPPDLVVVFGAVHTPLPLERAALGSHERWEVPGGISSVPVELAEKLQADQPQRFAVDDRFHAREHAVEVELPIVQRAWPKVAVLPIEVPAIEEASVIGQRAAQAVAAAGLDAVYLASSDLTHYGPAYGFTPAGVGLAALEWAKENDQRLLEVVTQLTPERVVLEVQAHANACGAGAIAAMIAACQQAASASEARVLRHASSFETLAAVMPNQRPDNAVGYAAVVIG